MQGGAILNVGFGLGLVDAEIESHKVEAHTIIEPHKDVLAEIRRQGYYDKPRMSSPVLVGSH